MSKYETGQKSDGESLPARGTEVPVRCRRVVAPLRKTRFEAGGATAAIDRRLLVAGVAVLVGGVAPVCAGAGWTVACTLSIGAAGTPSWLATAGAGLAAVGRGVITGPGSRAEGWEELDDCPLPKPRLLDEDESASHAVRINKAVNVAPSAARWWGRRQRFLKTVPIHSTHLSAHLPAQFFLCVTSALPAACEDSPIIE